MAKSLTKREIAWIIQHKMIKIFGAAPRLTSIQIDQVYYKEDDTLQAVAFSIMGVHHGINWDRNEITFNLSDPYIGGTLKHDGGY